jgi:5-formyltetrahydrofolate cyclo-ligase
MTIAPTLTKPELRAAALARRAALAESVRREAASAVAMLAMPLVPPGAIVALYLPIRGELDTGPLAKALRARGHELALPVVGDRDGPLGFRAWAPGDALDPGFGRIPQPLADSPAVIPDFLFVPLAAFDRAAHRLGYGAGFYDRTLVALRADRLVPAFGLAFAVQQVPALPAETHDVALDGIVTERGLLRPGPEI